jgi:hypothetical protein
MGIKELEPGKTNYTRLHGHVIKFNQPGNRVAAGPGHCRASLNYSTVLVPDKSNRDYVTMPFSPPRHCKQKCS